MREHYLLPQGTEGVIARAKSFSRGTRRKGRYLWSGLLFDELVISSTVQGFAIVASDDFTTAQGRSEVTLMGIRGWLSFSTVDATAKETAYIGIVKKDTDESVSGASMDPSALSFYIDEDILWTGGWLSPGHITAVGMRAHTEPQQLNIKARRKVATGQDISIQLAAAGGNSVLVSGVMRAIMLIN